jgi:hypothetical protein
VTADLDEVRRVRNELLTRFLEFEHGGLQFELLEPPVDPALRPPGSILLLIVDEAGSEVGDASRCIVEREERLVIRHKQLKLRRDRDRRRGFGSILQQASETWYRDAGLASILIAAEGDGSLFAARRGFDFDLKGYGSRQRLRHLDDEQLRAAALLELSRRPGIFETVPEDTESTRRPKADTVLASVADYDSEGAEQVRQFRHRMPSDEFVLPAAIAKAEAVSGNAVRLGSERPSCADARRRDRTGLRRDCSSSGAGV